MKTKDIDTGQDAVTIISAGVLLEGKLSSNGNIRIDGKIKGNVIAAGNVTIGNKGEVEGEVKSDVIILGGKVTGLIEACEKVILESAAELNGDLKTKILVVEEGAAFNGNCNTEKENKLKLSAESSQTAEQ